MYPYTQTDIIFLEFRFFFHTGSANPLYTYLRDKTSDINSIVVIWLRCFVLSWAAREWYLGARGGILCPGVIPDWLALL